MRFLFFLFIAVLPVFTFAQKHEQDTSFYSIYKNIFITKCAIPACHDGAFEPDLRTMTSAYFTLVYHPIVKNNATGSFKYRVVPYDTTASLIHERLTNCCFVNAGDQMPLTIAQNGLTLSSVQIKMINDWISQGAKDIYGNVHQEIHLPPEIASYYSILFDDSIPKSDSVDRGGKFFNHPFRVPDKVKQIKLSFFIKSDPSAPKDIKDIELKISSGSSDSILIIPAYIHDNWQAKIETGKLEKGKVYEMRLCATSPVTGVAACFPDINIQSYVPGSWSFIID